MDTEEETGGEGEAVTGGGVYAIDKLVLLSVMDDCLIGLDDTIGIADELGVTEGISVTGMAVDPLVESETNGTPGSNEGSGEETAGVTEELNVGYGGVVELIGTVAMVVELTVVGDKIKEVELAVKLAEGVGENEIEMIDTEMPLGAETVVGAEHCEETTLSPQKHSLIIVQLDSEGTNGEASRQ